MRKKNRACAINWNEYFEGDRPIRNAAGLSKTGLELLEKDIEQIGEVKPTYPGRVLRYALDGEGEDILPELEMLDFYFKAKHFAPHLATRSSREALFDKPGADPHDFLERLGRVYHALMNPDNPNFLMPARFHSPSWLEALLLHASDSYTGDLRTYLQLKFVEGLVIALGESEAALAVSVFRNLSFDFSSCEIVAIFFSLIDFPAIVSANAGIVEEALSGPDDLIVVQALMVILAFNVDVTAFAKTIARLALSGKTAIRHMSFRIISSYKEAFRQVMKEAILDASPEEKLHGIHLVGMFYGRSESDFFGELLERETAENVRKSVSHMLDRYGR